MLVVSCHQLYGVLYAVAVAPLVYNPCGGGKEERRLACTAGQTGTGKVNAIECDICRPKRGDDMLSNPRKRLGPRSINSAVN